MLQGVALLALAIGMTPLAWTAGHAVLRRLRYTPVDICGMKPFPFDENFGTIADIPGQFRQLDGHRVSIEGEMLPLTPTIRITDFDVTPPYGDRPSCPLPNVVRVRVPAGYSVTATDKAIVVDGTFHVAVERDDGFVTDVFQVTPDSVRLRAPPPTDAQDWPAVTIAAGVAGCVFARVLDPILERRLIHRGLCLRCSYDLRASTDRCPECGMPRVQI